MILIRYARYRMLVKMEIIFIYSSRIQKRVSNIPQTGV